MNGPLANDFNNSASVDSDVAVIVVEFHACEDRILSMQNVITNCRGIIVDSCEGGSIVTVKIPEADFMSMRDSYNNYHPSIRAVNFLDSPGLPLISEMRTSQPAGVA
jgi:hypothetical protein